MIYEYKDIHTDSFNKILGMKTVDLLNEMGGEGWKLIWIQTTNRISLSALLSTPIHTEYVLYFIREKKE